MSGARNADSHDTTIKRFVEDRGDRLSRVRGKWALIHETDILDFFDSREEALNAGYARLRDVPFVVRQIPQRAD